MKGQEKLKPRFVLTTEQTSACYFAGAYDFRAVYPMNPVEVTILELP